MLRDRDIYASANILIRRFGNDAKIEVAKRADERLEAGDPVGSAVWGRIVKAIKNIERMAPSPQHRVQ